VDGNGKVILLISPVVNRLDEGCTLPDPCDCGFIAGFFNPRDLYGSPPVPAGTSNHAEVLYLLAADPTGVWDCEFPVDETASENLGTITHEQEHLTSFSNRLFFQGGVTQVTARCWFIFENHHDRVVGAGRTSNICQAQQRQPAAHGG
jgi:hypothetical protein